jgi:hypothetical protein
MKIALPFLCLFCHMVAHTQDSTSKRPVLVYAVAIYDFAKSYGASARVSIPFRSIISQGHHENMRAETRKDQFVSVEAGIDRRPFAYTSAYFNVGVGIRFATNEKHFTELSFEQGVLRTFYDGVVYEQQSDGSIKELTLFGRTYGTTSLSYSQIWSISHRSSNAWFILVKPCIWIQYPYNGFLKPHLSLQGGVSYHLRDVIVRTRTKYKHPS